MAVVALAEALEHWLARYQSAILVSEAAPAAPARQAELPFTGEAPDRGMYRPAYMGRLEVKRGPRRRARKSPVG